MRSSLKILVNNLYTEKQKLKVKEIIRESQDKDVDNNKNYLMNYKILAVAVEDYMENELTRSEVEEIYKIEGHAWLFEIDFVIANLIATMSRLTNEDIMTGFDNALVLDNTQPEFDYLVNEVEKVLVNLN